MALKFVSHFKVSPFVECECVDIVSADIHTASEAGRALLAAIIEDQAAVTN